MVKNLVEHLASLMAEHLVDQMGLYWVVNSVERLVEYLVVRMV